MHKLEFCPPVRPAGAFAPIASFSLLEKAVAAARKTGKEPVVGNIVSSDTFYEDIPSFELWRKMGVLAVEMEAAGALYERRTLRQERTVHLHYIRPAHGSDERRMLACRA